MHSLSRRFPSSVNALADGIFMAEEYGRGEPMGSGLDGFGSGIIQRTK